MIHRDNVYFHNIFPYNVDRGMDVSKILLDCTETNIRFADHIFETRRFRTLKALTPGGGLILISYYFEVL